MSTIRTASALTAAMLVAFAVSACTPAPQPEAIATQTTEPAASSTPVESTTPEPPAAEVGTRENPVPVGQVLAFSADSAFQMGASAATQATPAYSVLPLVIQVDWANANAQATAQGQPTGGPLQPYLQFKVSFVTAAGASYDTMDDYTVDIPNQMYQIGDVYEGTDVINASVPVSVPEAEVAGGAWAVENYASGKRIFIAAQ
jgi:hypothetical protein